MRPCRSTRTFEGRFGHDLQRAEPGEPRTHAARTGRALNLEPPLRLGVDGYNLAIPRGTGIATYARGLVRCLREMGHPVDLLFGMGLDAADDPALKEIGFFDQLQTERGYRRPKYPSLAWAKAMLQARRGLHAFEVPITGRVERRPFADRLPRADRVLNANHLFARAAHSFGNFGRFVRVRVPQPPSVMFWTYPVPVLLEGARNIYVVHDVVPLRMPYATLDNKAAHMRLLGECLRLGDQVCTVSERSRDDLLGFFPHAGPKVSNTYQLVSPAPGMADEAARARLLRGGYGLEQGRYFLFFGSIEPKKNVPRLIQAHLAADPGIPLVVVSARAWGDEGALLRDRDPADPRLRQIEYLPADALSVLVQGARAVVFPSIYEGFGLPVAEAMALGTPVLTSREGSLPEVAGDAALLVDAYDVDSIAAGLRQLAADDVLCAALRERGLARAEAFGMAPFRTRMGQVLRDVMARPA